VTSGVYQYYRKNELVYIGNAKDLAERRNNHFDSTPSAMTGSAPRRNVAEHLWEYVPSKIKSGETVLTQKQRDEITAWFEACERKEWQTCCEGAALALERERIDDYERLHGRKPLLNKIRGHRSECCTCVDTQT
jgi:hypothetical protein